MIVKCIWIGVGIIVFAVFLGAALGVCVYTRIANAARARAEKIDKAAKKVLDSMSAMEAGNVSNHDGYDAEKSRHG